MVLEAFAMNGFSSGVTFKKLSLTSSLFFDPIYIRHCGCNSLESNEFPCRSVFCSLCQKRKKIASLHITRPGFLLCFLFTDANKRWRTKDQSFYENSLFLEKSGDISSNFIEMKSKLVLNRLLTCRKSEFSKFPFISFCRQWIDR